MKHYPIQKSPFKRSNLVPVGNYTTPSVPTPIFPHYEQKNHSNACSIRTRVQIKDKNGNEMNIYQCQDMINLLNGHNARFTIDHSKSNSQSQRRRKRRWVKLN